MPRSTHPSAPPRPSQSADTQSRDDFSVPAKSAADEAFFRQVVAASPDCIKVLDLDANLQSISENGRVALEIDDLTPHLGTCWTDWWGGADHESAAAAVEAAKTGGTGRFEASAVTPRGTMKWWDVTVTPIPGPDGRPARLLSVSREVTAQRAARDAAAERSDRLKSVVESATDYAVIGIDVHGNIDRWSTGAVNTFGWTETQAVGQPFDLIWTPDDLAGGIPGRELQTARETGAAPDNRWHVRSDGRRVYVSGSTRPVHDGSGHLAGFVKVCRDETDRTAAESALRATAAQRDALLGLQRAVAAAAGDGRGTDAGAVEAVLAVAAVKALAVLPQATGSAIEMLEHDPVGSADDLVYRAAAGNMAGSIGLRVRRSSSLSGRSLDEGRPLVCHDSESDDRVDRLACRRVGLRSMVVVPIARAGAPVGVLKLASPIPSAFTEADVLAVQLAAGAIGGSMSGAAEARALDALRQSEARFKHLADSMPQIVWSARPDGSVDYFNRRWFEYTGLPETATGDQAWASVIPDEDVRRIVPIWHESLRTGRPHELECRYRRASDGMCRWHLSRALPMRDAAGAIVRWFGTNTDIHDQKLAEAEREHLLEAERTARAQAELAGKMKDEFLATLSHELRTPLNAILGWTQILRSPGGEPEELAEALSVIDRNARAQTQIIEDILDMSRIVSGKLRLDVSPVDLSALVRAGADTVKPAADAKGISLQVMTDPAAGPVTADPGRLHQVFWNLFSNAVKFTPKGGQIWVTLDRVDSHVEVNITDTGEGITQEFLPYVFDRFRQADASTTRKHGGLGLGLAIVKQLVELHGGSVRVKSPGVGHGATFTVAMPLMAVRPEQHQPPDVVGEHPSVAVAGEIWTSSADRLAGVTVVVVDDEPDGVAMIKRLLTRCGAQVRTATSAADAMSLLASEVPAVLISDIGMPGEDGYALIRKVRALPADSGGRVPALALTAYARASDRIKALEAGFQMHLAKPVEPAELIVTVASLAKQPVR